MLNMNFELFDLLRQVAVKTDNNDISTHITTFGDDAMWSLSNQNVTMFWKEYCNIVSKGNIKDLCLAEKTLKEIPLMQEFTFKFEIDDDSNWEPYDDNFICWICYLYQYMLDQYYNITNVETFMVVVLESSSHWFEEDSSGKYLSMKIRLQFPNVKISTIDQDSWIRQEMITLLRKNNVLAKLPRQPIGDWDDIMSNNIKNTPVMLYGSTPSQSIPPLKLIHMWGIIDKNHIENFQDPDEIDILDAFSPIHHIQASNGTLDINLFDDDTEIMKWLPVFLSVGYGNSILLLKPGMDKKVNTKIENNEVFIFGEKRKYDNNTEDIELAEKLLPMIDITRLTCESFWLEIGRALYYSDRGNVRGLNIWTKYTLLGVKDLPILPYFMIKPDVVCFDKEKHVTELCSNHYDTFGKCFITPKTIGWYASKDNNLLYKKWHKNWCMESMEKALSCSDTEVCEALYRLFWLLYVYDNTSKKWFKFGDYGWMENSEGFHLKKSISNEFMKKFEETRVILSKQVCDSNDKNFKSEGEMTIKRLSILINKLKTVPFKTRLMIEAKEFFGIENFSFYLNKNPDLTGIKNGVLEILNNNIMYREAKPEDYVSMCAGVPYHAYFHLDHPLVIECFKWFGQIFPDKDLLHHFLKFAASCLKGRNNDKIFPIFTGGGDNSKSMIVKLFEATFSVYAIKLPVSILCEKSANSGNATPQLARAKSTRLAFLDEPEDDIPMNKGAIKRYTGGDSFFCRLLNENGGDVESTFKMILSTNKIPNIPGADKAVKNRTRIFPFLSSWVDNPPETEEEQYEKHLFKKDVNFEKRIPILAPAFLWIMIQYYPRYAAEGLIDPQVVVDHTEAYWKENDVYSQFIDDNIAPVLDENQQPDKNAKCLLSHLYDEFKNWFRSSYPGTKVPDRSMLRTEFNTRYGIMSGHGWYGIRLTTDEAGPILPFASSVKPVK